MAKLLIIATLAVIVFNLGAGLYYMLRDEGKSDRTVRALSKRIAVSIALFALILVLVFTGVIDPHGIQPASLP